LEKKKLGLNLEKVEKDIRREKKLLRSVKRRLDYIRIQLENLLEVNARQLEELSPLNFASSSKESMELRMCVMQMQEMSMSFSLQYLRLQSAIQQETREFTLLSNIMKARHEAAKNAINNIR